VIGQTISHYRILEKRSSAGAGQRIASTRIRCYPQRFVLVTLRSSVVTLHLQPSTSLSQVLRNGVLGNWLQSVEIGFTASDLEVRFLARHVTGPEAPGGRAGTRAEDRSGLGNLLNVRTIPAPESGCVVKEGV
jgi:hypothetical protein